MRWTLADDQVVRFASSGVLQGQDGPVLGGTTLAQFVGVLAGLGQGDGLPLGIADQLDRVVVVLVQTGRAWVTVAVRVESRCVSNVSGLTLWISFIQERFLKLRLIWGSHVPR